ncbi:MAG: folylpolyglutamate synthase/dihydrofolate synthase family protein [Pirellulales bacterium]
MPRTLFQPQNLMDQSNYHAALDLLYNRINYERSSPTAYNSQNFRLDRMRCLLEHLDNPQEQYPIIHIAGTKGKGTTASLIYEGLRANGPRVGLYTSPHLLRIEERFQLNGQICSEEDFARLVNQVLPAAEKLEESEWGNPTFFEITTAMAMLYFAQQSAECVVLEVGLGGRLDSTNVCMPMLTLITSISLDHQAQLGNTIREIAGEKAGIIKQGIPVISTALHPDARQVFESVAEQNRSQLLQLDRDFSYLWQAQTIRNVPASNALCENTATNRNALASGSIETGSFASGPQANSDAFALVNYMPKDPSEFRLGSEPWQLNLLGRHQAQNLSGAITALNWLAQNAKWKIDPTITRRAIANSKMTGRLQIVGNQPLQIIDTAHNPASVAAALEALRDQFGETSKVIVFASSRDKDYRTMLQLLLPNCDHLICTAFQKNPRAVAPQDLAELARQVLAEQQDSKPQLDGKSKEQKTHMCMTPVEAWNEALRLCSSDGMVLSIGSFFLAAELLDF